MEAKVEDVRWWTSWEYVSFFPLPDKLPQSKVRRDRWNAVQKGPLPGCMILDKQVGQREPQFHY
jgi:hypothetical protein